MRRCTNCEIEKEINEFDFVKSKKYINARRSHCKACRKIKNKEYYLRRKDQCIEKEQKREIQLKKNELKGDGLKKCKYCNEIKKLEDFNLHTPKLNTRNRRTECKSCQSGRTKIRYLKRKEKRTCIKKL